MAGAKIFSIEGKGLKLTTAEDIEPHIQDLKSNDDVEEIKFLGNTLGIGASEALAKVLEGKKSLQVIFTTPLDRDAMSKKGLTQSLGRKPRRHLHLASPL
jgi:Ran GTPase-activating protein (RanGAP) involved in mRNA processing and transport